MLKKKHAGEAGPVTPVVDQGSGGRQDDYRFRELVFRYETQMEIAKTHAWTGVLRLAILAFVVGVVLLCAMALGVPPPWELALALFFGKAPSH